MTRKELIEQVIACRADGMSMMGIANKFGITKNVVIGIISRYARELVVPVGMSAPVGTKTLEIRLDALHYEFDRIIEECKPKPTHWVKQVPKGPKDEHPRYFTY